MRRRSFLRNAVVGAGSVAGALMSVEGRSAHAEPETSLLSKGQMDEQIGRPVRVVSIGFQESASLEEIARHVEEEMSQGADVVALPELCRGQNSTSEESLDGPTVTAMAALAKKYSSYIAVPIDRRDGERRLNSVVFLDRSGRVVCIYDKLFPYWPEFKDLRPPAHPGDSVHVYQADFGRVGFATCFDVNFPEVWRRLSDKGAELVIWPSAYSAGASLKAHAINHHYYIVSSTQTPDCLVYDVTGEQLLYRRNQGFNVCRVTLDLDRGIYHENFNLAKRDKLLSDHPQDVEQETWMHLEQWFVLRAKRPGVSARKLAHDYGMEELPHYIARSRMAIDADRGWAFEERVVFPTKSIAELKTMAPETAIGKLTDSTKTKG